MRRRLIINADDLGLNVSRSHGIFLCFEQGIVRSATLVPNGSDGAQAARHAREKGLTCGLQLTLTEGYPLSQPNDVSSLLHASGAFVSAAELERRLAEERVDRVHLEREVRAQLEWCLEHHDQPSHLSSTSDVHLHPLLVDLLPNVLLRYGVLRLRLSTEHLPPAGYEVPEAELARVRAISQRAAEARVRYEAEGITGPEHFRGLCLVNRASLKNLRHTLNRLPDDATTEVMVHPGSPCAYGTPFDLDPQRQTELRMLIDPTVIQLLADQKVTLSTFADA